MNTKTKKFTWTSFAYALVLILLATTMVGIVAYAAGSKTHNIGGNVTFSADGIEATIGVGSTSGGETTKQSGDVMQSIVFSTTQSDDTYDENYSTWSDLEVTIDAPTDGSSSATATISFEVTNNLESDYLAVSLKSLDAGEATPTGSISVATSVDSLPTYISYESGNNTATISITFTVEDADYDAKIEGFEIAFTLEKAENVQTVGSFTYALNSTESTATVVSYNGSETEVTVEDTVSVDETAAESVETSVSEQKIAAFANTTDAEETQTISAQSTSYSVTAIAANAFSGDNCSSITSLTLSSNLTTIGANAFSGCSQITTITIPKTVTAIDMNAFYGCTSLSLIKNKSSVEISESDFSRFGISDNITVSAGYTITINIDSSTSQVKQGAGSDTYLSIDEEDWSWIGNFGQYDSNSTYTTYVISNVFTINISNYPYTMPYLSSGTYIKITIGETEYYSYANTDEGTGIITLDSDIEINIVEYAAL